MFFRGRQHEAVIWRRFRSGLDGFSFAEEDGFFVARVGATAERVVDLFYALTESMGPAVDVAIDDVRSERRWIGENVPLPDVRETIARLRVALSASGGVELAVYSADDQITLTPQLDLYIYARTDRWLYILQGMGLIEQPRVTAKSWAAGRRDYQPAPELVEAVAAAAERLGLRET